MRFLTGFPNLTPLTYMRTCIKHLINFHPQKQLWNNFFKNKYLKIKTKVQIFDVVKRQKDNLQKEAQLNTEQNKNYSTERVGREKENVVDLLLVNFQLLCRQAQQIITRIDGQLYLHLECLCYAHRSASDPGMRR